MGSFWKYLEVQLQLYKDRFHHSCRGSISQLLGVFIPMAATWQQPPVWDSPWPPPVAAFFASQDLPHSEVCTITAYWMLDGSLNSFFLPPEVFGDKVQTNGPVSRAAGNACFVAFQRNKHILSKSRNFSRRAPTD